MSARSSSTRDASARRAGSFWATRDGLAKDSTRAFLGHFERRKLALGDCGRAYGTDCAHEHACVRCPVLIVHATERPRLVEIRDNLLARILEAEREGWLGEIEGLQSSLTHAEEKLAQLDEQITRKQNAVDLGIPTFREIVARTPTVTSPPEPS